jgi:phage repressor protein C with HTH and peptisase S24 domain
MLVSQLRTTLQNLTGYRPTQAELCRKLDIKQSAMAQRAGRDSDFSLEELQKLERVYAVNIITSCNVSNNSAELNYYPDVFASCGNGVMVFDDTSEKILVNKNTIPEYSETATYSVINARGFSMYPVISDNDKVIIKHWQGEQIIDDKIYLFDYKGELFIKRLVKNIDQVIAKSEDKTLEPRPMETSKLTILGRVISLIRTNL